MCAHDRYPIIASPPPSSTFLKHTHTECQADQYYSLQYHQCRRCPSHSNTGGQTSPLVCPCDHGYFRLDREEDMSCTSNARTNLCDSHICMSICHFDQLHLPESLDLEFLRSMKHPLRYSGKLHRTVVDVTMSCTPSSTNLLKVTHHWRTPHQKKRNILLLY